MSATKTSHDQLFKQVLGEFFPEFIELFFPQVAAYLDRDSIEFLPLELFADLVSGDAFETDLIVKVRFRGQESYFIIHRTYALTDMAKSGSDSCDFSEIIVNEFPNQGIE